jgi:hypothetical protein
MYDCTEDVLKHHNRVVATLKEWASQLFDRGKAHDMSKIQSPLEKITFDHWVPELKKYEFASDGYKNALKQMGSGLQMHYEANRHHPEHFEGGINDMSLIDIMEMLADWIAVAEEKQEPVQLDKAAARFGIDTQLLMILKNTVAIEDAQRILKANDGMPNVP